MTTYNTGNPLGSTDPRDLYDNAENLDTLVNDRTLESHPDRLGVPRKTWHSMEAEFDADQSYRESAFNTSQTDRQNRFNNFIASSGYQFLGDYAAGIEITEYNQIVRDADGEFWRVSGQVDLPYTTTGVGLPENNALTPLGDAVLRQELANPDKGAAMVAYRGGSVSERLDNFVMDASEFFAMDSVAPGRRYVSDDGLAWLTTLYGQGWFNHPMSEVGLIPLPVGGAIYVEQLPPMPDMTDLLNSILGRASRAHPISVKCSPGLDIPIGGQLHIAPHTSVDLGDHNAGGRFVLGPDGWITQDGRAKVNAVVYAETPVRNNPAYVFSTDFISANPALGHFETAFDLSIIGAWQDEAESLRIESSSSAGYAWVHGKADIREFHYGPTLETKTGGYLNSLVLDFRVYGAVEFYREINGGNEIAANRITLDCQPGRPAGKALAKRAVQSQAKRSTYFLNVWDWAANTEEGTPSVVFDASSAYNRMYVNASSGKFSSPAVVDLGTGNRVEQHYGRNNNPPKTHLSVSDFAARGDFTDVLLGAYHRFPVTITGVTPSAGSEPRAFEPGSGFMALPEVTSATIEVDLTEAFIARVRGLEVLFGSLSTPDEFQIHTSTDGGVSWSLRLESSVGSPQPINRRFDDLGFGGAVNRVRLTMTNSTPKLVRLYRFAMHAETDGAFVPYGVMLSANARAVGHLDVRNRAGNPGAAQTASVLINGAITTNSLGGPRPVSDNAVSVGTAALRFSEVYATNGAINTSDMRAKTEITTIPDEWLDAWGDVDWVRYKMAHSVAEKGDAARWHIGLIAQQIVEAFANRGLDAFEIGIVCYDRWDDIWSEEDDPSERRLIKPAGDLYAVRYDEAQALESAWIRRRISEICSGMT